jgi:uncharacterized repeat protein (TIGR02543 family)
MPIPERPGYTFNGWFTGINGAGTQIQSTTVWNTLGGLTVNAYWTPTVYTLTLDPSTGTCGTPSVPVTYGQAITSLPNASQTGCSFIGWFLKGTGTQINIGDTWIWPNNDTAVARFNYPVTVTYNSLGTVSISGTGVVPSGTVTNYLLGATPAYTCTPNTGAYIASIVVNGVTVFTGVNGTTAPQTYTFTPISNYHNIVVTFAPNCYPLNVTQPLPAGVTVTLSTGGDCVPHGSSASIIISTDCATITNVLVNGTPQGALTSYPLGTVTAPLPLITVQAITTIYEITASGNVTGMGEITDEGVNYVPCGSDKTYNFNTELGYRVSALYIDGTSVPVPVSKSYTFKNVKANHTIHVEFEEFPYYIIQFGPDASQNAHGTVFPTLFPDALYYIAVDSGTVAFPFSIVPKTGYEIDKVYVDGFVNYSAIATGTYTFNNVNANHNIYATFKPIMFTVNATTTAGGTITPNGAVQVAYGEDQPFMAVPNTGYHLVAVYVDGDLDVNASQTGYYLFPDVQANHTIHAVFEINTYTITPSAEPNGTINPSTVQTVNYGTDKTFYFYPQTGYKVDKVYVDGMETVTADSYTFFNINDDHLIHVTFTKQTFSITSTAGPNGSISPLGVEYVDYGEHSAIYVIDPAPGYHIKQVLVDNVNNPLAVENRMHRFLGVTANHTIQVFFAKNEYAITATATQGGTINPAGLVNVPAGEDRTFYFSPNAGYALVRVIVDGLEESDAVEEEKYTFYGINDEHTISAQFERTGYMVYLPDPAAGALVIPTGGSISPVNYGGKYTFVVELLEGYTKSDITVRANGMVINPIDNEYTISNITVDQYITIEGLALNTYRVEAKADVGGKILPAGVFTLTHGDSKTFQAIPNQGYKISDMLMNGESQGAIDFYTLVANGDATIVAYFQYNVSIDEHEATVNVFSHSNTVTVVNETAVIVKQIEIMDMYGRLVWTGQATGERTEITLNVAAGIYAVRIITDENQQITAKVNITK